MDGRPGPTYIGPVRQPTGSEGFMRDFLLLYVNGVRHEIRGDRAFGSLSDFLRNDLRLTGTKIVCAEGDCGSCSILLGRVADDAIAYHTVTSCIQFLYQLDGVHIVTVEGLKVGSRMSPVQDAMLTCHGAQCGFCTPGFVVAMSGLFESDAPVDACSLKRGLVGNLCRCTGYEAIIKAGLAVDRSAVTRLNDLYPPAPIIADIAKTCPDAAELRGSEGRIACIPTSLEQAVEFKARHPDCIPFAGGTDLGVQINKGRCDAIEVLALARVAELHEATVDKTGIVAGAAVDWSTIERLAIDALPEFATMLGRFASPPIRNAGTIGGNIANGSPIADSLPAFYVLGAQIELASIRGRRSVDINDFFTGYKRTVMAADELISRVTIPLPPRDATLRLYKVSKRQDLDISTFTAAFLLQRTGDRVDEIRIAYGGVGPNVLRLNDVETWLAGRSIDQTTFAEAGDHAAAVLTPISDVRGSAAYRARLAVNIFAKFFNDLSHDRPAPLSDRFAPSSPSNGNGKNGNGQEGVI